jgi:integrase
VWHTGGTVPWCPLAYAHDPRTYRRQRAQGLPRSGADERLPVAHGELSDPARGRALAATAPDAQLHTFVVLALATATRAGELWNLKWSDLDLEAGRMHLQVTKNAQPRTAWVSGEALPS